MICFWIRVLERMVTRLRPEYDFHILVIDRPQDSRGACDMTEEHQLPVTWLSLRRWLSPGIPVSPTSYNWLVTI